MFSAAPTATDPAVTATVCSYSSPFRVGVHFDSGEAIGTASAGAFGSIENEVNPASTTGEGKGTAGFYLAYWQNTC